MAIPAALALTSGTLGIPMPAATMIAGRVKDLGMPQAPGRPQTRRHGRVRWVRAIALALFAAWAWMLFGFGALKPGYSHVAQYISELNATGTPLAGAVTWFGFVPVGLLLAALAWASAAVARVRGASRVGVWLLLGSQSLAYLGAALAPCDPGCPVEGSASQAVHNLLGATCYPLGALGVVLLATAPGLRTGPRALLVACAVTWIAGFLAMLSPELSHVRGLLQRCVELAMVVALAVLAWSMTTSRAPDGAQEAESKAAGVPPV